MHDVSEFIAIFRNVTFSFTVRYGAASTLKERIISILKGQSIDLQVDAIRNLNLIIERGDIVTIVGANGSGKSTLLKLLGEIISPTEGEVLLNGTVASIIELGDCFNHELTGFENIILLGTLLGRRPHEMEERVSSIVHWCGLENVIHHPVHSYSTGMIAKLAVAIFTDVRADLILIDEILSVCDKSFQIQALKRITEFNNLGSAVVLVTHDLDAAREMAHKAIWIDHGRLMQYGEVNAVIDAYLHA